MAPIMASPLRSKSLDMVPLVSSKKRARSSEDDGDEVPRIDKKVGITCITTARFTHNHHLQPRPLPFRTSPTSQHNLAFSQTKKPRPTSLVAPLGFPSPTSSDCEGKRHSYPFQTPPRSKSSTKSGSTDAFSTFRDTAGSDTDMPDSPMDVSSPTTTWSSPATSPEDYDAPKVKEFASTTSITPPSPKSSRSYLMTPPPPRPSRFVLQPLPKPVVGQRLPTPTYGHFPPLSYHPALNTPDVSPKTHSNKTATLRRGLPTLLPPSPISENEFESPTTTSMGDLLSRLQMSNSSGGNNTSEGDSPSRAKLGRRMAIDQGQMSGGGKTTLVMGYRADCEKCRARVPGHYNHVVQRV
ncbi:MAG: hypothetical protein HETSPECPRED_008726 [Heterodermia speciosa]|uniref:Uncharacterized protein n=1 Tax=Heterodermia speciosa TaxID=116794 RepID=A0A8H3FZS5_9LECA|nr:MAG: hypothetical protein HETSPECPRED_008726 [Heterodermia speciosa]